MTPEILRPASVAMHFDSLRESMCLVGGRECPSGEPDPFFLKTAQRVFDLADEYGIKMTVFVIGRDLEDPAVARRVLEWHRKGHEIANHSYSHFHDLGSRSEDVIRREVEEAERRIEDVVRVKPVGFVAPSWSIGKSLLRILAERGYRYDHSLFPSWMKVLVNLKIRMNSPHKERFPLWGQPDIAAGFFGRSEPYRIGEGPWFRGDPNGIWELPVATSPWLRLPCYHTIGFMIGAAWFETLLRHCLKRRKFFCYVIHPLDLLDPAEDLEGPWRTELSRLERAETGIRTKMDLMKTAFRNITAARRVLPLKDVVSSFPGMDLST